MSLPYEPRKGYKYVGLDNKFMQEAMKTAKELAYDTGYNTITPIGAVYVKDEKIIMRMGNGSDYHNVHGCERKKLGLVGGDYELCPGCSYKIHCEKKAVDEATNLGIDLSGSDLYMFGHYWCCESCCSAMEQAGVKNYFLLKDCEKYFDRNLKNNKAGDFAYFNDMIKKL